VPFRVRQTELCLWRSRQLLAESDAAVTDIANQCGYHHVSFFNSTFKKCFGMTPGEWRRQARKNPSPREVSHFSSATPALFNRRLQSGSSKLNT
jgi:AraC-like DNA-binding protein